MNRDHPSLADYEARAEAAAEDSIRHGATLEEAQAGYETDMDAETYAARWQAQAESREPDPEAEPELEAG